MSKYQYLIGTINKLSLGQRLDQALVKLFPNYSRSQIQKWILDGLVYINGKTKLIPKQKVFGGESVEIRLLIEEPSFWHAQNIPLNIVYEDDDIIVINKPCCMIVHPGNGNVDGTIANALLHYIPSIINIPRAGIVHRLDKGTTGLMVIAKTLLAQMHLIAALKARKITREYEAITIGVIPIDHGTINKPIARHITKRTHMMVHHLGKPAVTHYRILEHFRDHTHLRLCLETGRTHQIRVHMAYINHPIVGDMTYGNKQHIKPLKNSSNSLNEALSNLNRQALHACLLRLHHPITSLEMEWYAPLPKDMMLLISALKKDKNVFKI